jgi:uncharacterized DUF497 family protein
MRLRVEWNADRSIANLRGHGVRFEEAATVLGDPFSRTIADATSARDTTRFVTLGLSHRARMLVVSHLDRGDTVWILTATPALRGSGAAPERTLPASAPELSQPTRCNFRLGVRGKYAARYWESTARGSLRRARTPSTRGT